MMKGYKMAGLVSILLTLLWLPGAAQAAPTGEMRIKIAEGDVQVKIAETGEWAPVAVNTPLLGGDEIWVPDGGRAALQTNAGAQIRLGGGTSFQILRMDPDAIQFHVAQGYVYVLRPGKKRGVLQFDTPDASVRSFGQSTFRIDIPGGETDVSVFNGSVTAENEGGSTRVQSGRMLALGSGGLYELSPLPGSDDWQQWNESRDRAVLARRSGDRYLPAELRVYSDDFESNGRWVNVQGYGDCWTPTVGVPGDWAPYRNGRWCWRGGDYVWIGDEPWGWTPYHYGRWAFEARTGWFWVPPERGNVYWGPGYVGWVRTPDHVAWVPLAPREVYYGQGNYGRYSVNITNVNVDRIRVTNVYRNVNVVNSITVVHQATFSGGRPVPVTRDVMKVVRQDFVEHRGVAHGRPSIKPAPASYLPVIRSVPESKRPPEKVRKIEMRQLQQSRPLVKDPNRSTIRPNAKPNPLQVRKVETPRPVRERAKARHAESPAEKNRAEATQGGPAKRAERATKPVVTPPPTERVRPQATQPPPTEQRARPQATRPPPTERVRPQVAPRPAERVRSQEPPPPAERVRPQATRPPPAERVRPQVAQPPPAEQRVRPQVTPPPAERVRPQMAPRPAERVRPQAPQSPPAERVRPQVTQPPPTERVRPQTPPPAERVRPQAAPPTKVEPARPQTPPPGKGGRPEPKKEKPERSREKGDGEERGGR